MLKDEKDIYRTANLLIEQYGDDALNHAWGKESLFTDKGDTDGAKVWGKIADAINWMQIDPDLAGETCH